MIDPRVQRIDSLIDLGRYDEALALLGPMLAHDPDDGELHGLHARVLLGLDDSEGALAAGNRLVMLEPDEAWGHRICAAALQNLGNHAAATEAAAAAVRLAPNDWQSHRAYATSAMGIPALMQHAYAAAQRAVQLGPHEPNAHFVLGLVAETLRYDNQAIAAYRRTLELDPNHAGALNNLNLFENRWSLTRAAHGFAAALTSEPDSEVARQNLDLLAVRFFRRLYWVALVAFVVSLAASGAAGWRVNAVSVGAGVVAILAVVAYAVVLLRDIPVGVRRYLTPQLVRNRFLLATAVLTTFMLLSAVVVSFVPGGRELGLPALRLIGLANVALVVWGAVRYQQ
jgi:Flp pilus assembly protein TadD